IAEGWYHLVFANNDVKHIEFKPKPAKDKPDNRKVKVNVTSELVPDLTNPEQIRDIKHVKSALDEGDKTQIRKYVNELVNAKFTVGDENFQPKKVVVVFTDPEGAAANAKYIGKNVNAKLEFEVFDAAGKQHKVNERLLNETFKGDRDALIAAVKAGALP